MAYSTISCKGVSTEIALFSKAPTETSEANKREEKGNSIIAFPHDYVVIDIETTGFDPAWNEIIELSAIRVRNDEIEDTFSTLVKPENEIDGFITELTGITNDMVADAPTIEQCIETYIDFIGEDIVVGYNVNFDINFIYDRRKEISGIPFTNSFVDVMRIARKKLPHLEHHRQCDVVSHYGIINQKAHRALSDCKACFECYYALQEDIIAQGNSLEEFKKLFKKHTVKARSIKPDTERALDPENPLYEKVCVFTGKLEKMTRADAMQKVVNIGGKTADGITKATNFLILGNNDYCKSIKDGKSSKQKKAESLLLKGQDIKIISEQVFYDMILEE